MESRWRLILQKDISSAYAMALDDALHRVAAEEQIGILHLYSTVPSLLLGRWQRMGKEGRASEERDVNRRPSGGGSITGGENVLLFSLALPSCCCDQWSKGLERASDVMKSLLKGRLCADGLIRDTKTVKGMLTVCSECEGAVLVQGGFPTRSAGIRSLAVAQRLLKEEFEKQFNIRFTIDTLTQKERDLLDRLMYTRYLLDEWRAEKEAPSNCAATKKEYADFCVSAETSGKVIVNLEIWGTFIGDAEIFKKRLVGLKAMKSEISKIFSDIPQDRIPYKFERQKILTTFLDSFKSK